MVKFTHCLVHKVEHLHHAKFEQLTINGFDVMIILVMISLMDFNQKAALIAKAYLVSQIEKGKKNPEQNNVTSLRPLIRIISETRMDD